MKLGHAAHRILTHKALTASVALFILAATSGCDRFVSADTRVDRAEQHLAKGDFRPALTELKAAVQKDPSNPRARLALAKLSWWLGDLEAADKELERAMAAGATAEQTRQLQYSILLDRQKVDEIKKLLADEKTLPSERKAVIQARVALLEKDPAGARAALDAALAVAPKDSEALLESARLDASQGRTAAALQLPDKVRDSPDDYARALYLRGAVLMSAGTFRDARDTLKLAHDSGKTLRAPEQLAIAISQTEVDLALNDAAAAEHSVKSVDAWAKDSLVTHYLRARIAILKRDFEGAVAESQLALRVDPQHVQSQLMLASAHLSLGALEQAQDTLTRLLASKPDTLAARKLLAQVYLGRNEPDAARRILGSGATDATDADVDWLMGAALMQSGSTVSAFEHLERSALANPTDVSRRLDLASAYIGARNPEKAIELLADVPAESPLASRAKMLQVLATALGKPRTQARQEVVELAQRNRQDPALLSAAASVLASIGDTASAREFLNQALAIDPRRIDTLLTLARVDASERKLDAAEARLNEIIRLEPAHQIARLALAELSWARSDRPAARKWLEDAIKADPSAVDARLRLAQLSFIEGDGKQARGLLDQVLDVSKDRKIALAETGKVLARAGLSDEAVARFKEAGAAGNRDAYLDSARLHLDLNDLGKARQAVDAALATNAKWPQAQQLMVVIDARDGQVDRAFERAKGLTADSTPASLAALRGDLQALAGEHEAATVSYENAQRLQPSSMTALKLFQARRLAGQSSPERELTQWLARSPQDLNVRRTLAVHYQSAGKPDLASVEYERLIAANSNDVTSLNNLAWLLHEKNDPRALELAKRAVEGAPRSAEIADTYGWILVRMGRVAEGMSVLQSALKNAPTNPDILYHAAVAYQKSGDLDRAMKLVNDALSSKGEFASRAEAEQLARELSNRKPS